jgi:hypothetical protein
MKNALITLTLTFLCISAYSQVIYKDFFSDKDHLSKTILFAIPEIPKDTKSEIDKMLSQDLVKMITDNWELKDVKIEALPYSQALEKFDRSKHVFAYFYNQNYTKNGMEISNGVYGFTIDRKPFNAFALKLHLENDLSKADFMYAIMTTQFIYKNADKFRKTFILDEAAENFGKSLTEKTLLIDKEHLTKITEAEIARAYKYKFKIVDKATIDEAIVKRDPTVLVLYRSEILWSTGSKQPIKIIYQPVDGALVSYSQSKFSFGNVGLRTNLVAKDFTDFVERANLQ